MDTGSSRDVRSLSPLQGETRRTHQALVSVLGVPVAAATRTPETGSTSIPSQVTPAASTVASRAARLTWMDGLRGLAIVLVVALHTRNLLGTIVGVDVGWVNTLVDTVSPVRMPLLMLLSGMLLSRSLAKGARIFLSGKLRRLAWPYIVWSLLYTAVWALVPDLDGVPHDHTPLDLVVAPVSIFWYLHTLLLFYLLALLMRPVPVPLQVSGAAALWVVLSVMNDAFGAPWELERTGCLLFFFLAGELVARHLRTHGALLTGRLAVPEPSGAGGPHQLGGPVVGRPSPLAWILLATLSAPLLVLAALEVRSRYELYVLPSVLASMVLLALLVQALEGSPVGGVLAWLGRQSLVVYVVHWVSICLLLDVLQLWLDPADHPLVSLVLVGATALTVSAAMAAAQMRSAALGALFVAPSPRLPRPRRANERARVRVQG